MASIKSLQKIAEKNPVGFLQEKLSFVNFSLIEKIDAHSIQIEKRGTSVIIWKRNGSQLLTKIDRILDIRWKPLMLWVLANKSKLSENIVYHFDYLPYHKVNQVHYENLPLNYLFLTAITFKNGNHMHYETLENISRELNVTPNLKLQIDNYSEIKDLLIQMSQNSLTSTDNSIYKDSFICLKKSLKLHHDIEGLILTCDSFTAKIMSPEWKESHKEEPDIKYQLVVSMMMDFLSERLPILELNLTEKIQDRRYIQMIDQMFLNWIIYPDNLIEIVKPSFIGELNMREINQFVRKEIQDSPVLQLHYSIMLNAFRKNKNKDWGIFNEEKRNQWNLLIYKINKYIEKREGLKPFSEYKNNF